jgi:RNA polymerase sigma-70 factor (ECF subfamily)
MLGDLHEAEDVAQDVFVRAYRAIGVFRGEAKLSTWLIAITMNLCRNRRRWWNRRRRVIAASLDDPVGQEDERLGDTVADPAPSPAQSAQASERRRMIESALQALDAAAREVVVLRDLQGYSYEDMAALLKCRIGTVKSRLSRARMQLRTLLTSERVME